MADSTSRDDEKSRDMAREMGRIEEHDKQRDLELAAEKGRKEEQALQRERELAAEKARKQEMEADRMRQKERGSGFGTLIKIVVSLIVLFLILLAVGYLTLSVEVSDVTPGNSMPFQTSYGVSFPEGQKISIGNIGITVLSYQNELISDIDGDREKLVIDDDRVIKERRAVIRTLGSVTLIDTIFQINLKYKGNRDNRAYFDMAIHTSQQVPDVLLRHMLPREIDARPI